MPSRVGSGFIVSHSQIAFAFLKTLLNRPPHCSELIKYGQFCIWWCITDKIFDCPILVSPDIYPYFGTGYKKPVSFAAGYTADTFNIRYNGAFCSFRKYTCNLWNGFIRSNILNMSGLAWSARILVTTAAFGSLVFRDNHIRHGEKDVFFLLDGGKVAYRVRQSV